MIKKGFTENPNSLTEQDFVDIANKTEMFSGSDMSILVRDAVYQPVRRLQLAKMFKKLQNGKWTPCKEG